MNPARARVLIIEDMAVNRRLLTQFVESLGHEAVVAESGLSGLAIMKERVPDLVLLDIMMPGMDGIETLQRMKADAALRDALVLVITGVDEVESAAKCLTMGADDYIVKPYEPALLRARIQGSLEKKRLRDEQAAYAHRIESYALALEDRVRERTRELSEAHERLQVLDQAKSDFINLISHELRTPLAGLLGAAELAFEGGGNDEDRAKLRAIFDASRDRITSILDHALMLAKIQAGVGQFSLKAVEVQPTVWTAIQMASSFAARRGVALPAAPETSDRVLAEEELLAKALSALLETSVKFCAEGSALSLSYAGEDGLARVTIEARGRGVPSEAVAQFFDIFSVAEPITPGGDLGLAPALAQSILRLFGGKAEVTGLEPPGARFTVTLKLAPGEPPAGGA